MKKGQQITLPGGMGKLQADLVSMGVHLTAENANSQITRLSWKLGKGRVTVVGDSSGAIRHVMVVNPKHDPLVIPVSKAADSAGLLAIRAVFFTAVSLGK